MPLEFSGLGRKYRGKYRSFVKKILLGIYFRKIWRLGLAHVIEWQEEYLLNRVIIRNVTPTSGEQCVAGASLGIKQNDFLTVVVDTAVHGSHSLTETARLFVFQWITFIPIRYLSPSHQPFMLSSGYE